MNKKSGTSKAADMENNPEDLPELVAEILTTEVAAA